MFQSEREQTIHPITDMKEALLSLVYPRKPVAEQPETEAMSK
jgi:hypothetical protein